MQEPTTPKQNASAKKPYPKPVYRSESVFEVSALSCGKIDATQQSCRTNKKAS
jgi:hypothetical protein